MRRPKAVLLGVYVALLALVLLLAGLAEATEDSLSATIDTEHGTVEVRASVEHDEEAGEYIYEYVVTNVSVTCNLLAFGMLCEIDTNAAQSSTPRWDANLDGGWWMWDAPRINFRSIPIEPGDEVTFWLRTSDEVPIGIGKGAFWTNPGSRCGGSMHEFETLQPGGTQESVAGSGTGSPSTAVTYAGSADEEEQPEGGAGSPTADCLGEVLVQDTTQVETPNGLLQVDVCAIRDPETGADTYKYTLTNVSHCACPVYGLVISQVVGVDATPLSFDDWIGDATFPYWGWDGPGVSASASPVTFMLQAATATVPGMIPGASFTPPGSLCGSNSYGFQTVGPVAVLQNAPLATQCETSILEACVCESEPVAPDLSSLAGPQWVRTGGPPGGIGYDIRMRSDNPDVMYVTDAWSGAYVSTDAGASWVPSNTGITIRTGATGDGTPVFCLTVDPNDDDVLWAGMQDKKGLFKSVDGGAKWTRMDTGIAGDAWVSIRGVTVDPRNSLVAYAAGELGSIAWAGEQLWGQEFDLVKGFVYKTIDGGHNWEIIWEGENLARYVWIDPRNSNVIFVSTGIFDREAANSDPKQDLAGGVGILKSTDGGETWDVLGSESGLGNLYIGSLYMHPDNPDILLAGTGNITYKTGAGVYLSTDAGGSWRHVLDTELYQPITSIEFSEEDPSIAYAAGNMAFFRSRDGGQTWVRMSGSGFDEELRFWGPAGMAAGFPIDIQVDPRDPDRIFANNYGGGNIVSEDGGRTWADASAGYTGATVYSICADPEDPWRLYSIGRSGLFCTCSGGLSWQPLTYPPATYGEWYAVAVNPENSATVLASDEHQGVMLRSSDGGLEWEIVYALPAQMDKMDRHGFKAIAFAPAQPSIVYAGMSLNVKGTATEWKYPSHGVFKSYDCGRSWQETNDSTSNGQSIQALAVGYDDPEVVYAATLESGVLKTENGGGTWRTISSGIPSMDVRSVTVDPRDDSIVFCGLNLGGVYKSTDGGTRWSASSQGMLPEASVRDIVVSPADSQVLYAADYHSGVYVSVNGGASWSPVNAGLATRAVLDLAISSDASMLYVATDGEGVFRMHLDRSTVSSSEGGDRDGDGVPDEEDMCPDFPGTAIMNGC